MEDSSSILPYGHKFVTVGIYSAFNVNLCFGALVCGISIMNFTSLAIRAFLDRCTASRHCSILSQATVSKVVALHSSRRSKYTRADMEDHAVMRRWLILLVMSWSLIIRDAIAYRTGAPIRSECHAGSSLGRNRFAFASQSLFICTSKGWTRLFPWCDRTCLAQNTIPKLS